MESSAKTRLPLHSIGVIYPSLSLRTILHYWYNLHSYLYEPLGEKVRGLSNDSVLTINAKGGENISPKQKDCTTTTFQNFLKEDFSIGF
jgi:hypothetical protein